MPQLKFNKAKPIVISIGGSLIVPNGGPDARFLSELRKMILPRAAKGQRFVIVTGGGKTARHYIQAAVNVRKSIDPEDLDWLGIHATRLNGHLVRTLFREIAYPVVLKNPMRVPLRWQGKILVAAGWKPGWSTDYVACRIAKRLGVDSIINASNIDYVYDRDPNKYKNAKKIEEMAWKDFRKIVGDDWDPGKSAPFDPVASKFCHKNKIKVAIVNGVDIKNVGNVLSGRLFQGTLLS